MGPQACVGQPGRPAMGYSMGQAAPMAIPTDGGFLACFKCEGKGFCHLSSMDHDANLDERCFFCKDCDGCGGKGRIPKAFPVPAQTRGQNPACFKCEGKGFRHTSHMDHDGSPDERCFFCEDCD